MRHLWSISFLLFAASLLLSLQFATAQVPNQRAILPNSPPVLDPLDDHIVHVGDTLNIQLHATDPDNNNITYFTNADGILPSQPSFYNVTGYFTWSPNINDSGRFRVIFGASDGKLSDVQSIRIIVPNVDPIDVDFDGDGILNKVDNCPHTYNPAQVFVCDGSSPAMTNGTYVFLQSRTIVPQPGVENGTIPPGPNNLTVHVLLYIIPGRKIVLSGQEISTLNASKVKLLSYVGHYAYFAAMPKGNINNVSKLNFIRGIGKIRPIDRIDLGISLRGGTRVHKKDGSLNVTIVFFQDIPQQTMQDFFTKNNITATQVEDEFWNAHIQNDSVIYSIASADIVEWIEEEEDAVDDLNSALPVLGVTNVWNKWGFSGDGYVASMQEAGTNPDSTHPDFSGRIVSLNLFGKSGGTHSTMVAGTLIADGTGSSGVIRGVMPDADLLVTMVRNRANTPKTNAYKRPTEAQTTYGAIFNTNSWTQSYACGKAGKYTTLAKWFDESVYTSDLPIIKSSGNGMGTFGDYAIESSYSYNITVWNSTTSMFENVTVSGSTCVLNLSSIGPPAHKDGLLVGSVSDSYVLAGSSSSGPTADGRLKPDVVSIGVQINTTIPGGQYKNAQGTSFSAPITAGILGLVHQAYDSFHASTPSPATLKALIIHSAQDILTPGPDYYSGYGVTKADAAVELARIAPGIVIEDSVSPAIDSHQYTFTILPGTNFSKVTLVWSDEPGDWKSWLALKNDLTLEVQSPSGYVYYPYRFEPWNSTAIAAGIGSSTICTPTNGSVSTCRDGLNTVEQVPLFALSGKSLLENGTWIARVNTSRLISASQDYSLVIGPKCPVVITQSLTLDGNITCGYSDGIAAVEIASPNVVLDCNGYTISGSGISGDLDYTGIRIDGNSSRVTRCQISGFDVGISTEGTSSVDIDHNNVTLSSIGIRSSAQGTNVEQNRIISPSLYGIEFLSQGISPSNSGFIRKNNIRNPLIGIRLYGNGSNLSSMILYTNNTDVYENNISSALLYSIEVSGLAGNNNIYDNRIFNTNQNSYGIVLYAANNVVPVANDVFENIIQGPSFISNPARNYVGIELVGAERNHVYDNLIEIVTNGINERSGSFNNIESNTIQQDALVGIFAESSEGSVIDNNDVLLVGAGGTGIEMANANTRLNVTFNRLLGINDGIIEYSSTSSYIVGNIVDCEGIVPGDDGVQSTDSFGSEMLNNSVFDFTGIGVALLRGGNILLASNNISGSSIFAGTKIGISVANTSTHKIYRNIIDGVSTGLFYWSDPRGYANVTQNTFATGSGLQISSPEPLVVDQNKFKDISLFNIFDVEGDGYGECGSDFPYTANQYNHTIPGGLVTGANQTTMNAKEIADYSPATTTLLSYTPVKVNITKFDPASPVIVNITLVNLSLTPLSVNLTFSVNDTGHGLSTCSLYVDHNQTSSILTPITGNYTFTFSANHVGTYLTMVHCVEGASNKCYARSSANYTVIGVT